ncbi:hypothetical protein L5515_000103 [Caenorhabditis briggsae]|uniref:Uncharacterized protein n=1 Tax=Caenorhabditis briggsae TaxID=6238 RepID=A0AAE9E0H6_CAEBR|nr:hypothetical protein L5515_000103 [Caenorhabditis briggsae]
MVTLAQREKGIRSFAVRAQLLELGESQLHWTHPSQRDAHRKSLNIGSPMNDIDDISWRAGALRSGALGSGALGSGALGSGALGSGALGSGALGSGALGSERRDRSWSRSWNTSRELTMTTVVRGAKNQNADSKFKDWLWKQSFLPQRYYRLNRAAWYT